MAKSHQAAIFIYLAVASFCVVFVAAAGWMASDAGPHNSDGVAADGGGRADLSACFAEVREAVEGLGDASASRLAQLAGDRKALEAERTRLASEMKKETRKRKRLLAKARLLSTEDLLAVVAARGAQAKAAASPRRVG